MLVIKKYYLRSKQLGSSKNKLLQTLDSSYKQKVENSSSFKRILTRRIKFKRSEILEIQPTFVFTSSPS